MTPKPKAETGAGLRPTGLLPYIYRVKMAIRMGQQTGWSLDIHHGKHAGAATRAARTRADKEVAKSQGKHTVSAFLDCSKCYEGLAITWQTRDQLAQGCDPSSRI